MAATPTYPKTTVAIAKTILPADTTAWVDVYDNSAGSADVCIEALALCSDDTSTVNIAFGRYVGSTTFLMGTVRAVTLSGTDGAAARVEVLTVVGTTSASGIKVIHVPPGTKLQAKSLVTVTSAKTVTITGCGMTFAA
jgi:hypothetical protein